MFNDDVQGTGVVTLAAIYAALKITKTPFDKARIVFFGAGTAGTGIADQFCRAVEIDCGKKLEDVRKEQIWCMDKPGLLLQSMHSEGGNGKDELTHAQVPYAREDEDWKHSDHKNLLDVVKTVKPHILVGTSTKPGSFTEEIIKEMAKHTDRPIVFPLSNPTDLHEAKPEDVFKWSDGKALMATGSPFPLVEHNGTKYEVAECNNSTAFPGIGLGGVLCRAKKVSDKMLLAATKALAEQAPSTKDEKKGLLPDVQDVRAISVQVARAVIQTAVEEGLNEVKEIPKDKEELEEWIKEQMWDAEYRPYKRVDKDGASREAQGKTGMHGMRHDGQDD